MGRIDTKIEKLNPLELEKAKAKLAKKKGGKIGQPRTKPVERKGVDTASADTGAGTDKKPPAGAGTTADSGN